MVQTQKLDYKVTESLLQHHGDVFYATHRTNTQFVFSLFRPAFMSLLETTLKRHFLTLTAVGDDPDGGVTVSKTIDGSETHLVRFGSYQLGKVVCHELPFADGITHRDLLLPPALQAHLKGKTSKKTGLVECKRHLMMLSLTFVHKAVNIK